MTTNEAEAVEVRCPDCDAVLDPNPYYPGRYFPCLSKACQGDALGYTSRGDAHLMAVRALQRWYKADRRRFRKASDPLMVKRYCIQYANDSAFCNPPPQSDDAARDRWAARWYALYASKAATVTVEARL